MQIEVDRANLDERDQAASAQLESINYRTKELRQSNLDQERHRQQMQQKIIDAVKLQKTQERAAIVGDAETTQEVLAFHS